MAVLRRMLRRKSAIHSTASSKVRKVSSVSRGCWLRWEVSAIPQIEAVKNSGEDVTGSTSAAFLQKLPAVDACSSARAWRAGCQSVCFPATSSVASLSVPEDPPWRGVPRPLVSLPVVSVSLRVVSVSCVFVSVSAASVRQLLVSASASFYDVSVSASALPSTFVLFASALFCAVTVLEVPRRIVEECKGLSLGARRL